MHSGRGGVRGAIARYRGRDIELKTPAQLQAMRRAGMLVATTLAAVTEAARPGVSTLELDALAESTIRAGDGVPSFLGYHGFPAQHLRVGERADRARHPVVDAAPAPTVT